jgi:hypothetical protein
MKCPDCEKRVGFDDFDSLETEVTLEAQDGTLEMQGAAYFACPECNASLLEAEVAEELEIADAFGPIPDDHEAEYAVIAEEFDVAAREDTVERPGKPGKPARKVKEWVHHVKAKCTIRRTVVDAAGDDVPGLTEDRLFELAWECPEKDFSKCE